MNYKCNGCEHDLREFEHHGMWCRLGNCTANGCTCGAWSTTTTLGECLGCPPFPIFDERMREYRANPNQDALPAWVPL